MTAAVQPLTDLVSKASPNARQETSRFAAWLTLSATEKTAVCYVHSLRVRIRTSHRYEIRFTKTFNLVLVLSVGWGYRPWGSIVVVGVVVLSWWVSVGNIDGVVLALSVGY